MFCTSILQIGLNWFVLIWFVFCASVPQIGLYWFVPNSLKPHESTIKASPNP